jgi:hypothetical protein
MKSYLVRRRFNPSAASGNETIKVFLPVGFGTPKFGISFFVNGGEGELLDETSLDRAFGLGFIGLAASDNSSVAFMGGIGLTHSLTHSAGIGTTLRKAVSGFNTAGRMTYELKTDRTVTRQATSPVFYQDRFEFIFQNTSASSSYLDIIIVLFSGDDIDARIGSVSLNTTNNLTATVTGMAFAPDAVLTLATGQALTNADADARFSFGCAIKSPSIKNSCSFFRMRSNASGASGTAATTVHQYFSTDRCHLMYAFGGNALLSGEITAFTNDGFTVTSRSSFPNSITNIMVYMALKSTRSGTFDLQDFTTSTSTGISGVATSNFIPSLLLGVLGSATSTGATITSNDSTGYSIFAAKSLSSKSINGSGTLSVSSGSTQVTGTGTTFRSLCPGDKILNTSNIEIGKVSYVSSDTSLFLSSNASSTITSGNYSVLPVQEFSAIIGSSNLSSPTKIFSGLLPAPIYSAIYGTSSSASEIVDGVVNNFDSYPGFKVNYSTANATARKGWFLAFKDNENRRRDAN